eukprot:3946730-Prorocentrum_lima.AAC.1
MTSSLVGSEMCIRDRECHGKRHQKGKERVVRGKKATQQLGLGQRPNTVSYTHLTLPTICSV